MKCSPLAIDHWPAADRSMWNEIVASGDILDHAGPGARWRSATRLIISRDYGYWLSFLQSEKVDFALAPPLDRITPERVRKYVVSIGGLAASTCAGRLRAVAIVATCAGGASDWTWLVRMRRSLDAKARRHRGQRKQHRIVASHKLVDAGIRQMRDALLSDCMSFRVRAIAFRDGLMIALLASRPLRRGNFASLRLGYHLHTTPTGYRIEIPNEESKTGQIIETAIPDELVPWLDQYLDVFRPRLLDGAASEHLWISKDGRPYSPKHLGDRITKITRRLVGVAVNPHLFRDCAATTIATVDPEHVRMVTPLLGHRTPVTAERYYNQAGSMEAGRAHQKNIRQLRKKLRPLTLRPAQRSRR